MNTVEYDWGISRLRICRDFASLGIFYGGVSGRHAGLLNFVSCIFNNKTNSVTVHTHRKTTGLAHTMFHGLINSCHNIQEQTKKALRINIQIWRHPYALGEIVGSQEVWSELTCMFVNAATSRAEISISRRFS